MYTQEKPFNRTCTISEIANFYKRGIFNAHCFILSGYDSVTLLATEQRKVVLSENNEGVQVNGGY